LLFTGCEDVIYNDLSLQSVWEKECEVDYEKKEMSIKFDADNFFYKEASAADWNVIPCAASFGVLYIKKDGGTIKGTYSVFWTTLFLSGFEYETGFMWLNGTWKK
jgi:hypothetical protein